MVIIENVIDSEELLRTVFTPTLISRVFSQRLICDAEVEPSTSANSLLSLLKALYKVAPSLRCVLANDLRNTSAERVDTCKLALKTSRENELDINRATSDILQDCRTFSLNSLDHREQDKMFPLHRQEHPHDCFIAELLYFMITNTELNNNLEGERVLFENGLHQTFFLILINVLKCYGVRYAKSTSECSDLTSIVLKYFLKSFQIILSRIQGLSIFCSLLIHFRG